MPCCQLAGRTGARLDAARHINPTGIVQARLRGRPPHTAVCSHCGKETVIADPDKPTCMNCGSRHDWTKAANDLLSRRKPGAVNCYNCGKFHTEPNPLCLDCQAAEMIKVCNGAANAMRRVQDDVRKMQERTAVRLAEVIAKAEQDLSEPLPSRGMGPAAVRALEHRNGTKPEFEPP